MSLTTRLFSRQIFPLKSLWSHSYSTTSLGNVCASDASEKKTDVHSDNEIFHNRAKDFIHIHGTSSDTDLLEEVKHIFLSDLLLFDEFVSPEEETMLMKEVKKGFRRSKYQYDHWDGAIHGYRETEKSKWTDEASKIIKRVQRYAFPNELNTIPAIHVLDLAKDGHINPHVDSIKFCGSTIAGISLLSSAVMRFRRDKDDDQVLVDLKLPQRSLYVMSSRVRYDFTHEILSESLSKWRDEIIPRDRRVSVMMRSNPSPS